MENASKALLIAGGILISILTISIFYYMFSRIGEFRGATSKDTKEQAVLDFNQSFEAYHKKVMYGIDVISVINKAKDNNKIYKVEAEYDNGYYVDISFVLKHDLQVGDIELKENVEYSITNNRNEIEILLANMTEFKRKIFYCSGTNYHDDTGRLSKMTFVEKQ